MCFYVLLFSAFNGREIHIGGVLMEGRFILGFFSALIISDFMQIDKLLTVCAG
jgi:hypothetical protein